MQKDAYLFYRTRLETLLAIPFSASDFEIHQLIAHGFEPDTVLTLNSNRHRFLISFECNQIVSNKALKMRAARNQRLTTYESDRVFKLVHVTAMAEAIFGDSTKAVRWLAKPKKRFAGRKPYEMLSTTPGTWQVERLLIGIADPFPF
ncbi:hypothetical protein D3C87_1282460 [compost metagenome]